VKPFSETRIALVYEPPVVYAGSDNLHATRLEVFRSDLCALQRVAARVIPSPGEQWCVSCRHEPPPFQITALKDVDYRLRGNDGSERLSYGDQADLV
jgi:hypothetical protein